MRATAARVGQFRGRVRVPACPGARLHVHYGCSCRGLRHREEIHARTRKKNSAARISSGTGIRTAQLITIPERGNTASPRKTFIASSGSRGALMYEDDVKPVRTSARIVSTNQTPRICRLLDRFAGRSSVSTIQFFLFLFFFFSNRVFWHAIGPLGPLREEINPDYERYEFSDDARVVRFS